MRTASAPDGRGEPHVARQYARLSLADQRPGQVGSEGTRPTRARRWRGETVSSTACRVAGLARWAGPRSSAPRSRDRTADTGDTGRWIRRSPGTRAPLCLSRRCRRKGAHRPPGLEARRVAQEIRRRLDPQHPAAQRRVERRVAAVAAGLAMMLPTSTNLAATGAERRPAHVLQEIAADRDLRTFPGTDQADEEDRSADVATTLSTTDRSTWRRRPESSVSVRMTPHPPASSRGATPRRNSPKGYDRKKRGRKRRTTDASSRTPGR